MFGTQLGGDFVPNNTITGTEHLDNYRPKGNLTIDIEACDQSLSKRMTIYNVETTYDINYNTGETRQ